MEIFTSVWVILMLYCTELLGIRQCVAVPLPTLANYHSPYSHNSWHYRQTRYPERNNEKFVFPGKQEDGDIPVLAEQSGLGDVKIYFPDDIPPGSQDKDKGYLFANSEVRPVWKTQYRPSSADSTSEMKVPSMNPIRNKYPSQDGTIGMQPSTSQMQRMQTRQPDMDFDTNPVSHFKSPLSSPSASAGTKKLTQQQIKQHQVQTAVQDFYKWLQLPGNRAKNQKKISTTTTCLEQSEAGSGNRQGPLSPAGLPTVSDQSLVAGLKSQKCPEGQIRLENGECRVKVEI